MTADTRPALVRWHAAAVAAVQGESVFRNHSRVIENVFCFERGDRKLEISLPPVGGRLRVIGIGKAALGMARGFRASLQAVGRDVDDGLLIIRDAPNPSDEHEPWGVLVGNHPYPGEASVRAARQLLDFIGQPRAEDRFVVLLSGGASALCALPAPGVTLEEKRRATLEIMSSGASISEINRVRQQFSAIKGGRLAEYFSLAEFVTLAISDVPGDDPLVIGSAPTWSADLAARGGRYAVIATLDDALDAAAIAARIEGFEVVSLGRCLYGSVEDATRRVMRAIAEIEQKAGSHPDRRSVALIAGGEPLVVVRGAGRGGRAQELALRLGRALASRQDANRIEISGLVTGTDGSDGPTIAAGAFFDGTTISRAHAARIDVERALEASDSGSVLEVIDDLFITGPTGTNVADVLMVVIPGARNLA